MLLYSFPFSLLPLNEYKNSEKVLFYAIGGGEINQYDILRRKRIKI